MRSNKKRQNGFTIIESVIVLFIIGLLTVTASIGFSRANREKKVDQASRRVSSELGRSRDSSYLGQEILLDEAITFFPCGYSLTIEKDKSQFKAGYTNNLDRLSLSAEDKICDEEIKKEVSLVKFGSDSNNDFSLGSEIKISEISKNGSGEPAINCLTIIFSAPRQGSYYCYNTDKCIGEEPINCAPKEFSGEDYFEITFEMSDKISSAHKKMRIFPSGNTELIIPK